MLRKRFTRTAYATFAFLSLAMTPAFAQQAPGTGGCASFGDTSTVDNYLKGFLNWIAGTPFKVMAAVAIVVMLGVLLFDGGQLPQIAKTFLGGLIIVFGALMIVGIIMGAGTTCY
jgi:type IV secretory pathway VirB2 component (pilin)